MKNIFLFFLSFLSISFAKCQDIKGVWYAIDKDCTYYELVISDSLLTNFNSATGGCSFVYNYVTKQDTICLFYDNTLKNTNIYEFKNQNTLCLYYNKEWHDYYRVNENVENYFLLVTESEIDKYLIDFQLRGNRIKSSRKYKSCE